MATSGSKRRRSKAYVERAVDALETWGLLLLQDPKLPSLVGLIAGEPVRGSWWSHPKGEEIFVAAGKLDEHDDVLATKLVSGKVTFVHRSLWRPLIAIGRAREPWQLEGLRKESRALLDRVDEEARVRASGKPAKELEQRLLVTSRQVHTEHGKHVLELTTWKSFAREAGIRLPRLSPSRARQTIEDRVTAMNERFTGNGKPPWPRSS